ncbi:MAG TPA: PQQ-dependent sugar dehydrogenase [Chloroflexota bacterium]|nr:PQQ-dependent sugar dehydrogenase [Chloroflexota bacterium]
MAFDPRRRPVTSIGLLAALLLLTVSTGACNTLPLPSSLSAAPTPTIRPRDRPTPTPLPRVADTGEVVEPKSQTYVNGVTMPVALNFAPDGRLFFNEATNGTVRVAERVDGQARLRPQAFAQLETAKGPESGMLGLALHPEFEKNHWVYLYYTEPDVNRKDRVPLRNRVVRFTERDNVGTEMTPILDDIGVSRRAVHNGGVLRFGPDGKLYVTVGNAENEANSQDPKKLNGKILRLNDDGSIPDDNPTRGSPVYALGFRNPFGLTFEPNTGQVWITENSGDHDDEVNAIEPGGNYGFPTYEGFGNDSTYKDPIWSSGSRTIGPTGLTFYTGDQLPQLRGDLFFCAMNTGELTRLRLGGADRKIVMAGEAVVNNCHLDVVNGPDGALYYATVNQILRLGR